MRPSRLICSALNLTLSPLKALRLGSCPRDKGASLIHKSKSKALATALQLLVFGGVMPLLASAQTAPADAPVSGFAAQPGLSAPASPASTPASSAPITSKSEALAPEANTMAKAVLSNTSASSSSPKWADLSAKQQLALRPLLDLWPEMSEIQKKKWLALTSNFSDLNSKDQEKLQARMSQWSVLSPQQRAQARVIFAQVQQFQGDERLNKWQEYQALDPEKKSQLAQNLSVMPNSAAISPKPKAIGANNSMVYLPAHKPSPLRLQVDQIASHTLLPPKQNRPAP